MFSWKKLPERPIVIAHRGASASAPENTIAAFQKAAEDGAHAIELDVRLSRDKEIIVIHDSRLERTTNGRGKVSDYNLKDIQNFDNGSWFSSRFSREYIPTLEQVIKLTNKKVGINLEIKSLPKREILPIVEKCIALVQKYRIQKSVLLSSFDHSIVKTIKKIDSSLTTGIIYSPVINFRKNPSELAMKYDANAIVVSKNYLRDKMVEDAHKNMLTIYVYKVENVKQLERMINSKVDGVMTSSPKGIRNFLRNR